MPSPPVSLKGIFSSAIGRADKPGPTGMGGQNTGRLFAVIAETGNHQTTRNYRRCVAITLGLDIGIQDIVSASLLSGKGFHSKPMIVHRLIQSRTTEIIKKRIRSRFP